jgi:hypothetical protein
MKKVKMTAMPIVFRIMLLPRSKYPAAVSLGHCR